LLESEEEAAADAMLVAEPTVSMAVANGPRKMLRMMINGTGRGGGGPVDRGGTLVLPPAVLRE
jgi:hypothetical protein